MTIRREEILVCDVEGCDAEASRIIKEGEPLVREDQWITLRDYSFMPEDPKTVICICPKHNIRLKA